METLLLREKWGDRLVANAKGIEWAALDVVRERLDFGYYYHGEDERIAARIVERCDLQGALAFLYDRRDFEYEGFDVQYVQFSEV